MGVKLTVHECLIIQRVRNGTYWHGHESRREELEAWFEVYDMEKETGMNFDKFMKEFSGQIQIDRSGYVAFMKRDVPVFGGFVEKPT